MAANSVTILVNDGNANFTTPLADLSVEPGVGVPAALPRDVHLADVDMDGDLDILTANSDDAGGTSSVSIFLNDGAGNFAHATNANFAGVAGDSPLEVGRRPYAVRVADMNGDGAPDILTASAYDDGVTSKITVLLASP